MTITEFINTGCGVDAVSVIYKLTNLQNGKIYIGNSEYLGNGETQYVIYLLDNTGTGITELARTNVVKSAKTFNMAGMKVGKNAKGIVILQGGKKYFNKQFFCGMLNLLGIPHK